MPRIIVSVGQRIREMNPVAAAHFADTQLYFSQIENGPAKAGPFRKDIQADRA